MKMRVFFYRLLNIFSFFINFRYRHRLRVLAYHDIKNTEEFDKQIKYLKANYSLITINELKNHCYKKTPLPKYPVLITFDDGDISVLRKGLPVLKENDCPACLFIITSLINSLDDFWCITVRKNDKMNGIIPSETNKKMNHLKRISNADRIHELKKYQATSQEQLTTSDLNIFKAHNVYIGNHSNSHPMFDKCTEEEIKLELKQSRSFFESCDLEGFDVFAYPNGNYDKNSEKALKENNVSLAFLFDHKICRKKINPIRISRIRTNSDMSLNELKAKVSGFHSMIHHFKKSENSVNLN